MFFRILSIQNSTQINNFILGARILGDKQSLLRSLDPLIIYENRGTAFFLSTENLFSTVHSAVITEPYRNIRAGIFCDYSFSKKMPEISFGLSSKPYRNTDLIVKVDAKGTILASYHFYLNKSTTFMSTWEVE